MRKLFRAVSVLASIVLLALQSSVSVMAQSSANYSTREYYFGTGGDTNLNSAHYNARSATGALGVDNSFSTTYGVNPGTITPDEPYIEFVVNASNVNLGQQTTGATTTGTATFYVKCFVSNGYVVRNASPAPTYAGHTLASPSSAVAPAVGTEQFGINLVANTSPSTFGADPVQIPSGSYSFGTAAAGYNTTNLYKYVNGDVVAQSTKSSGETDYTISYILNISTVTPAGLYTMNHILVATGTY